MREFKFRIWDKEKGEWFLTKYPFSLFGECVLLGGLFSEINSSKLDNYVIQQFTGLLDKNGREVYEGDICSGYWTAGYGTRDYKKASFWLIEWDKNNAEFSRKFISIFPNNRFRGIPEWSKLEIIGNIFENPELLVDK